ncbi:potassium channel family protein [Roseomonas sp. HF4]|uniref:potassium channel family protein n=1 Tax=Roseomonas sp. HF4 TaxID=2562313 RepID=UPI00197E68BB|nr:potassium channel family protein [Roseomonas sp. HF4]
MATGSIQRAVFLRATMRGLRLTWPILSATLSVKLGLGLAVALAEGWSAMDGLYFAFVTGLSIGYGDLVPHGVATKVLAVAIGLTGLVFTGLVASIAVAAVQQALRQEPAAGANRR